MTVTKFNRNHVSTEGVNIVNYEDKKYTNNIYIISIAISNAINPSFLVYSDCKYEALNRLAEFTEVNELSIFSDYYELIDDYELKELEDFFQADNGLYANLDYFYFKQLER